MNSDEQLLAKSSNAQPTKKFANTGMKFSSHILNNALHLQQSSEVALKQRGDNFLVGAPGTREHMDFAWKVFSQYYVNVLKKMSKSIHL
jgi:hypothetical protein